ncbi:MAG: hypothetical protein QW667_07345 [Candidatus Bathyarchaeia archaeon]
MKVESAAAIIIGVCTFLSFYFAFLSFQTVDSELRKQFVALATSFLFGGIVMVVCMAVFWVFKRFFRIK